MLIAISGGQSSGKTSILNELKNIGFNVIERKTSRSILKDWNTSLSAINSNPDLTIRFQNEIVIRKLEDEKPAIESNQLWFCERGFSDLYTYALINLGKDNNYSDWLQSYYDTCNRYQQDYLHTFYIKGGFFTPEYDSVRGSYQHYVDMVDRLMLHINQQMIFEGEYYLQKLTSVGFPNIYNRLQQILSISFDVYQEYLLQPYFNKEVEKVQELNK